MGKSNYSFNQLAVKKKVLDLYDNNDGSSIDYITFKPRENDFESPKLREILGFLLNSKDDQIRNDATYDFNLISNDFIKIIRVLADPFLLTSHLENFDRELGKRLKDAGCDLSNVCCDGLCKTKFNYIPGPVGSGYDRPYHTHKIMESLLREREKNDGINEPSFFIGFVDYASSYKFLKTDSLFKEDVQIRQRLILHGKNTHRLFFEVARDMIRRGELEYFKDSLQLLKILTEGNGANGIWNKLIDYTNFHEDRSKYFEEFDAGIPFNFHSLIICFGSDFGLKNLQKYLLNSHYKQVAQMWHRYNYRREKLELDVIEDFRDFYKYCFRVISSGVIDQNSTSFSNNIDYYESDDHPLSFFLSDEQLRALEKYNPVDEKRFGPNIVYKKFDTACKKDDESWESYSVRKGAQEDNNPLCQDIINKSVSDFKKIKHRLQSENKILEAISFALKGEIKLLKVRFEEIKGGFKSFLDEEWHLGCEKNIGEVVERRQEIWRSKNAASEEACVQYEFEGNFLEAAASSSFFSTSPFASFFSSDAVNADLFDALVEIPSDEVAPESGLPVYSSNFAKDGGDKSF